MSYYPEDSDSNQLHQKEVLRYFLIHDVSSEDCYRESQDLNMFFFMYEWNIQENKCEDKRALVRIENFPTYLCLKLPNYGCFYEQEGNDIKTRKYYENDESIYWDEGYAKKLYFQIRNLLKDNEKEKGILPPFDYDFGNFGEIYYYSPEQNKPYMYLFFRSIKDKDEFKSKLVYPVFFTKTIGWVKVEIHEEKITPLMRLMNRKKLKYNTWFSMYTKKVPFESAYRVGNQNVNEYYGDFTSMEELDQRMCISWKLNVRICAFDFECYSHRGIKRMPDYNEPKDVIFLISVDFKIMGDESSRRKYCMVYGETEGIDNAEVIHYNNEADLLIDFSYLLRYLDPDYLMGHNTYGFDNPYWIGRYSIHHIPDADIPNFGRLSNFKTRIYAQNWKSSGYGQNSTTFIEASGINQLDMLPNMKRLHKLKKYSLEFLSQTFLGKGKNPVTVLEMFDAFRSYLERSEGHIEKMTKIAKYCIVDSTLPVDMFEQQKIFYHLFALSGEGRSLIRDIFMGGEQRRCYSLLSQQCYQKNIILQNSIYFDYFYSGGFVGKPKPKVCKFVFTPDFTSLYPSIMQAYNLCYKTFVKISDWPNVPAHLCNIIKIRQMEPKTHFSLSRKKDIEEKIKIKKQGYNCEITDEEYSYVQRIVQIYRSREEGEETEDIIAEEEDETKPKKKVKEEDLVERTYEMRFVKKEVKDGEGLMPELQRKLVAARKEVKNLIKDLEAKSEEIKAILSSDLSYFDGKLEEVLEKLEILTDEIYTEEYNSVKENIDNVYSLGLIEDKEIKSLFDKIIKLNNKKNTVLCDKLRNELDKELEKINIKLEELSLEDDVSYLEKECLEKIEKLKEIEKQNNFSDDETYSLTHSQLQKELEELAILLVVNDKKQNAIKVVANSGYGFTGVRRGMLAGIFIAMCVTYMGRKHINEANDVFVNGQLLSKEEKMKLYSQHLAVYMEPGNSNQRNIVMSILSKYSKTDLLEVMFLHNIDTLTKEEKAVKKHIETIYVVLFGFKFLDAEVIYNDTDSSMVSMNVNLDYNLEWIGKMMEIVISGNKEIKTKYVTTPEIKPVFPPPLKMEFEDVSQMVPIKPKYYLKAIRETDPAKIKKYGEFKMKKGEIVIKKKGVLTAKRGNTIYSMELYQDLSDKVLFLKPIYDTLLSLSEYVKKLLTGFYKPRQLTKITELGSNYKQENYYMNVFSKNLKLLGKPIAPGDRIEYIIVRTDYEMTSGKDDKTGMKCREIEMWEKDENREPLDYKYYAEKGIQKQYDDLFRVGYAKIILDKSAEHIGYQPIFSRCKFVHFSKPIAMISAIIKDLMKPDDNKFEDFLIRNYNSNYDYERYFYIAKIIEFKLLDIIDELKEIERVKCLEKEIEIEVSDSDDDSEIDE